MPIRKNASTGVNRPSHGHDEPGSPMFKELEVVRLSHDFVSPVGMIPKGTEATILQVFDGGAAYQVEFEGPYEVPETVPAGSVEAKTCPDCLTTVRVEAARAVFDDAE